MLRYLLTSKLEKWDILITVGIVCVTYSMMISGLISAEQLSPLSNINGYADAFKYSIVVIFTAGYGDLFPVTASGRLIGYGFIFLSFAFYACVILTIIRLYISR